MKLTWRTGLLAGGLVAFLLGVGATVAPGMLALGLDMALVPLLGLLTLLLAVRAVQSRRSASRRRTTTPDPEVLQATPRPGDDFDETLADFLGASRTYYGRYTRRALRQAAIGALTRYEGCSEAEADERIDAGAWTDDPYAAAYLQDTSAPLSATDQIRHTLGLESFRNKQIRHTVDAIAAVANLSFDPPEYSLRDRIERWLGRGASESGHNEPTSMDEQNPSGERLETNHWTGVSVVALLGLGLGLLVNEPAVVLVGTVGIGYAAYAHTAHDASVSLAVDRTLSVDSPPPGESVDVTVTVTNEGDRHLPDLRLVDGVPPGLAVAAGSPRLGTVLRPGESATFSYTVTARRGRHEFGSLLVIARDITGGLEQAQHVPAETALTCLPQPDPLTEPVPLRTRATRYAGQVRTSSGGAGVEFYATREYRRGDPLGRIDWNRQARTGELATLEFREERAATVVALVDTRERAFVAPEKHEEHAVDRSITAAGRAFETLLDAGNRVGVAAVGDESCWLAPATGMDHRVRARELLGTHAGFAATPRIPDRHLLQWKRQFRRRLASGTQVVLFSPLVDDVPARLARQLEAYGFPVTVISPDPTTERTPGHRLARTGRQMRLTDLRSADIEVVDWDWNRSLDAALAQQTGGGR